jgi:AcrR family transcriptional regulator
VGKGGNKLDDVSDRSLRERKKAKTRALLQAEAFRLFTIEQIAEAAEVSPSTVFRYFPTKPDLVLYDDWDETFIEQFRTQPPELDAIQAIHNVLKSNFGLSDKDMDLQLERGRLMQKVPELRGAMLDEFSRTLREIKGLIVERANRTVDDDEVLALSGAIFGVVCAAWLANEGDDWMGHFMERIDKGMDLLESGFRK